MRCTRFIGLTPLVVLTVGTFLLPGVVQAGNLATSDFENLTLAANSYYNGTDATYNNGAGQYNSFQIGGATVNNYYEHYYDTTWQYEATYWDGWAYSNKSDIGSLGYTGQYTAMGSGSSGHNGAHGSAKYGIAYYGWMGIATPTVTFDTAGPVSGAYFTNTAYAYGSMLNGDSFAKKFGGPSGSDMDWFKLTITGRNTSGAATGTVDFYLADFRFSDNAQDYIIHDWTFADLSSLGSNVKSLEFGLTSSDTGGYGMNTPSYFAMDAVPEPSAFAILCAAGVAGAMWRHRRRFFRQVVAFNPIERG